MKIRIMKMSLKALCIVLVLILPFGACQKYLDIVPDNVATLDNAFAFRAQAKKFLYTCYSYMPKNGDADADPAMNGGDEMWRITNSAGPLFNIARGFQKVVEPYGSYWSQLYKGIRDCNIFLDNIDRVPDLFDPERSQWKAEVRFLKAYYYFYLVRMYGPVPLIKENIPITVGVNQSVPRAPVDSCFNYIVDLLDEAKDDLLLVITDQATEMGRITKPVAYALKAKVLVYEASPLFNGNGEQGILKGEDGNPLFTQLYSSAKWDSAVVACKQAIDICEEAGMKLYHFQPALSSYTLTDTMVTQLSIRNSITEKWNSGLIWGNTRTNTNGIQALTLPMFIATSANLATSGLSSPPIKIAEMFYSDKGLPITDDKDWDYGLRYGLQVGNDSSNLYVKKGYTTVRLNFNREPRYYADLGFDGGVWYGNGLLNDHDSLYVIKCKWEQSNAIMGDNGTITGYFVKKFINYKSVIPTPGNFIFQGVYYPWPNIRLADLYLLYAEALNESMESPNSEVFKYINEVRVRAGIPTVQDSWDNYSTTPGKYADKNGMREILHRERMIELAFEGQRFWDLRRWKEAIKVYNQPIEGWNIYQVSAENYYVPKVIMNQKFFPKDYFWPISERDLTVNPKLVQNIGW